MVGAGLGALALQLTKAYGAHTTAVDSTSKLAMIRSLGADEVIDYTREDFTRCGVRYDLLFDVPGKYRDPFPLPSFQFFPLTPSPSGNNGV